MADFYKSNSRPNGPDIVQRPMTAGTAYTDGEFLALNAAGTLVQATGATKPAFLAAEVKTGVAGENLSVYRIMPGDIYKTWFAADGSALAVGSKVTLDADAKRVTATAEGGVAAIWRKMGDGTAGTPVLVTF